MLLNSRNAFYAFLWIDIFIGILLYTEYQGLYVQYIKVLLHKIVADSTRGMACNTSKPVNHVYTYMYFFCFLADIALDTCGDSRGLLLSPGYSDLDQLPESSEGQYLGLSHRLPA